MNAKRDEAKTRPVRGLRADLTESVSPSQPAREGDRDLGRDSTPRFCRPSWVRRPRMFITTRLLLNTFKPLATTHQLARMSSTYSAAPTPPTTARSRSPPSSPEPSNKRLKLDTEVVKTPAPAQPKASTSKLPYSKGLHLAPMVRIGTLPTRLMCE